VEAVKLESPLLEVVMVTRVIEDMEDIEDMVQVEVVGV